MATEKLVGGHYSEQCRCAIGAPSVTMRFRPCIDIHAGEVKQIVGSTLTDSKDAEPVTNFVASQRAGDFARYCRSKSRNLLE